MVFLSLSLAQYVYVALGVLMIGTSVVLCIALLYWLIRIIETKYPEINQSFAPVVTATVEENVKTEAKEKKKVFKKSIEPSVPDDIPTFNEPINIETNFGSGSLGKIDKKE